MTTKSREEWLRILRENDVPCAPVTSRQEPIDWRQTVHNGMRVEIQYPGLGETVQMGVQYGSLTHPVRSKNKPRGWDNTRKRLEAGG